MMGRGDVPLTGFRSDELEEKHEQRDAGEAGCATINLRPSWWRHDGAGEGGDEFVRGMGEWLGLVEVLNKPVYLEGLDDDDEDE